MNGLRRIGLAALLAAMLACEEDPVGLELGEGYQVLFIGNSMTETNYLTAIVHAFADSAGVENLAGGRLIGLNYGLAQHWAEGEARALIRRGGWDVVVLQQGPSALYSSRVNLLYYSYLFEQEIRAVGATPALFATWPASWRMYDYPESIISYELAADSVDGILLPAGEAWSLAFQRDSLLPLYGSDGYHASYKGSYLAALVIFGGLYGRSPLGLPAKIQLRNGTVIQMDTTTARVLQESAAEALADVLDARPPVP